MHPSHHVHISTGFMFVCLVFIVVIVALFVWLSWSKRQDRIRILEIQKQAEARAEWFRRVRDEEVAHIVKAQTTSVPAAPTVGMGTTVPPCPQRVTQPVSRSPGWNGSTPTPPVVVNTGSGRSGGSDFVEGALLGGIAGSMMGSRDHETVIERDVSTPAPDPAPDPFAGSGSDAGSSCGGFDYSSGGGDSGGGFDCGSSGGSDGGGCDF